MGGAVSVAQMGFLSLVEGQEVASRCLLVTPELAEILRNYGFDPATFNHMRWPHGAGRHASCRVVMTGDAINALAPGGIAAAPLKFRIGDVDFDKVYLRTPRPMIIGAQSLLYAIEVVDERWYWNSRPAEADHNIYSDAKNAKFTATSQTSPTAIVSALLAGQSFVLPSEVDMTGLVEAKTDTYDGLRDLRAQDLSFGDLIDRVCAICGVVFAAHPSPVAGKRYAFLPVDKGASVAIGETGIYTAKISDLMAGGLYAAGAPGSPPAWIGSRADLGAEMPASVRVMSPTWVQGNAYAYGQTGSSGPTWTTKTTHASIVPFLLVFNSFAGWWPTGPAQITAGDSIQDVWDTVWTEVSTAGTIVDASAVTARAKVVARLHYSRFIAGCGESLWRGCFNDFPLWAGALDREWGIASVGDQIIPHTRISGDWNDPRLGWTADQRPVTQGRIAGVGMARAVPRPDGGVLIDVPIGEVGAHVIAWITTATLITGKVNRWYYAWEEVEWSVGASQWQTKVGGRSGGFGFGLGPAVNGAEATNEGTDRESTGVDIDDTDTANVTLIEIGKGGTKPVFRLYRFLDGGATPANSRWVFSDGNEVDVECTEASQAAAGSQGGPLLVTPQFAMIQPAVPMSAAVLTPSASRVYFVYLGMATTEWEWSKAFARVETAGAGAQSAQVGICIDDSPPDGSGRTFTIEALADLASLTTTGGKTAEPASAYQVAAGSHVWMAVRVAMATTQPRMRAVDHDCGVGAVMHASAPVPLTVGSSFVAAVATSAPSAPWVAIRGSIS